jgi:zinc protease
MGDHNYFTTSAEAIKKVKRQDIGKVVKQYLRPEFCHKGYLLPASKSERAIWHEQQRLSDEQDIEILKKFKRTTPVEPPKVALKIKDKEPPKFKYPIPKTFFLDNGLEVVYHNRPGTKKVSLLLGLKADYLYETSDLSGMSTFLHLLLLEGTTKRSAKELGRYIESQGMSLSSSSGLLSMEMLSQDFDRGLDILNEVVTEPAFKKEAIEKVRLHMFTELKEFWDTPSLFVDVLAKEAVYGDHPYSKNRLGHKECIATFSRDMVTDFYSEYMTPEDSVLIVVGDLSGYNEKSFQKTIKKHLGSWKGKRVKNLIYPVITYKKPKSIHRSINRDQVVLALAAPSISRLDKDYDAMAILDFVFTGGGISSSSRLYKLREQTGIFYTIGGSLMYGATDQPGMMFIKTVISPDKVEIAQDLIRKEMKKLREKGLFRGEAEFSVRSLISASVRVFESSRSIAKTFLFFKRCGMNFDLFDKRGAFLSILRLGAINTVARRYCNENILSTIKVGRSVRLKV